MRLIAKLSLRLRSIFRRGTADRELNDELRFHLDRQIAANIAAGMPAGEARNAALRAFGGVDQIHEACHDMRRVNWLQDLTQDIRYCVRTLSKSPGFTAVAVLTLALGIGANTAMFSVVNSVVLNPLPFKDSSRVVAVWWGAKARDLPAGTGTLEVAADYQPGSLNLTGSGAAERIPAAEVSENFFRVFGLDPVVGRTFSADDEKSGHAPVVILSHDLWEKRYHADPDIFTKTVYLNGKGFSTIGVMPAQFDFPSRAQIWLPLPPRPEEDAFGGNAIWRLQIGRLRPQATLTEARNEMQVIQARETNGSDSAFPVRVQTLHDFLVGDTRQAVFLLFGAVAFVLLIACADVANLLLARGAGRTREVAVRRTLGATRSRLVRQFLSESVLLSLGGGVFGLLCGWWAIEASRPFIPARTAFASQVSLDGRVFAFTCVLALATGVIAGVVPAFQSTTADLSETLKQGARGSQDGFRLGSHRGVRNLFGICEIALALILVIGAALFLHSLGRLLDVRPGFRIDNVLVARLSLLGQKYQNAPDRSAFLQQVLRRARALPGVDAAAFVNDVPLDVSVALMGLNVDSVDSKKASLPDPGALYMAVSPGYFRTTQIPLIAGRDFQESDTRVAQPVAIVTQTVARSLWPNRSPLGSHFTLPGAPPSEPPYQVVGVVGDTRHFGLSEEIMPAMYFPVAQQPPNEISLLIHADRSPLGLTSSVRQVIREIDPNEPVSSFNTMEELFSHSISRPRFRSVLISIFGALALLLAWVGVYSVISYTVAQRTHEIGVRVALGADRRDVLRLITAYGFRLAVMGIVSGMIGAFFLARLATSFLYGVEPADPFAFVIGAATLILIVFLASYVPARRATSVDPMVALRSE